MLSRRLRKLLEIVDYTPVAITDPEINDPVRIQRSLAQITAGGPRQIKTVNCNGTVYAWWVR